MTVPVRVTRKSRYCLSNYDLIFFPVLNQSITSLPSILIFSLLKHDIAFHSGFLSFAPVGKRLYGKFLVLPVGPVLRGVWSCRIDVDNTYDLVVDMCPCVATEKSRHCLPNYGLIFFPILNQSITALPSILIFFFPPQARHCLPFWVSFL